MDLDLAPVRTRGRAANQVSCEIVRELNQADMALLDTPRGVQPTSLKRIRDAHHNIARAMASGLPQHDIAAATGYSQSRLSVLKADPAFAELVAHYRKIALTAGEEIVADGAVKLMALRNDAIDELHARLEEAPEGFANADVLDVIKATADRTGLGPASKSTNVNISVGIADGLAARRRRASGFGSVGGETSLPSGELTSAVRLAPPSVIEGEVLAEVVVEEKL